MSGIMSMMVSTTDLDGSAANWHVIAKNSGGTFETNSLSIASGLMKKINSSSFASKIVYFLPFLGSNLSASLVPLIDKKLVGAARNVGFVENDYSQSGSLVGDGVKYIGLGIKPSDLGTSNSGGIGVWRMSGSLPGYPIGMYSTTAGGRLFALNLSAVTQILWWGDGNSPATVGLPVEFNHYYGQRSSGTLRELYKGGNPTPIASNTFNNPLVNGISDTELFGFGIGPTGGTYATRLGAIYLTDGTLTANEITSFYNILSSSLIVPTGR